MIEISKERIFTLHDFCTLHHEIALIMPEGKMLLDVLEQVYKAFKHAKTLEDYVKIIEQQEHQGPGSRYLEICAECAEKEKQSLKKAIFVVIDEWFENRENEKCGLGTAGADFEKFNVHLHHDGTIHCPGREDY